MKKLLICFLLKLAVQGYETFAEMARQGTLDFSTLPNDVTYIHLIPHSHDDLGWLKTVDEYFTGSSQNIQRASVENTLDTVIDQLAQNPDRTFVYNEMKFFNIWWSKQTAEVKARVR